MPSSENVPEQRRDRTLSNWEAFVRAVEDMERRAREERKQAQMPVADERTHAGALPLQVARRPFSG